MEITREYEVPIVNFPPTIFYTDEQLYAASLVDTTLVFDVECYPNFWYVAFQCVETGRVVALCRDERNDFNVEKLKWIISNFKLVGFNSNNYDIYQLWAAIEGHSNAKLKAISDSIILGNMRGSELEAQFEFKCGFSNHIDIHEPTPAPGRNALKLFGARTHTRVLQELPYDVDCYLTDKQKEFVKLYCVNDLVQTAAIFKQIAQPIKLREEMSLQYGYDLRSKSDPQVAESVILNECAELTGTFAKRLYGDPSKVVQYQMPEWMTFYDPGLKLLLQQIQQTNFVVESNGKITLPSYLKRLKLQLKSNTRYQIGIGGLHSTEKSTSHESTEHYQLIDRDVASYYPAIILNAGIFPQQVGSEFLDVYRDIVDRRLLAKIESKTADTEAARKQAKSTADSLKICVNGSFGKLGSMYSALYAPELMLQVTLTGQLALLMLIEMAEYCGIEIVSANTDGIVAKCPRNKIEKYNQLVKIWEDATGFKTEETLYKGLYSASVNNYIAITEDGKAKSKGAFYLTRMTMDEVDRDSLMKTCNFEISSEAAIRFLRDGTDIAKTIRNCKDVTKFTAFQRVKDGCHKYNTYIGSIVRWYIAKNEFGAIERCDGGGIASNTTGGTPLMVLDGIPKDLDRDWYVTRTKMLLKKTGYYKLNRDQKRLFE